MVLTTLYAQSKGINALYKSVEISSQVAKDFSGLLSNVRREQDLQDFFETHDPASLGVNQKGKLTPEVVQLALTLPALLALRYTDSDRFNRISISGDLEGKFLEMAMSDFYVALSFLSEEDLRKEESYIKLEQEGPSRQVQEQKFDLGQMSTNYATEVLVNAYPQTLVMGNPGVGKSTFANWLCHEWAGGRLSLERIPVHVNLKEVTSLDTPSAIVSYLAGQYVSCDTGTYLEMLKLLGDHFHFIFDGFDELSQSDRKKFRRLIRQFREGRGHLNYTLLGRPYAFFDQHFQEAKKFRIRGFNTASIERYLEATVGRLGNEDKSVVLLHKEVIGRNAILREYAHSPLILSYIVLVYLSQPLPIALRKLKGIKSKYGLYEEVYQWLADYNLRQKDSAATKLQEADFSFAKAVSFQKTFRYQADSIQGEDFAKATTLSAHGLGSLDRYAIGEYWRFGFSSVAIQEYLTARHLAQTINAEQFVYLSRDTFFWNTCQLLVGALTREGEEKLLDKVFERLQSEQEEGASASQGRFLRNRYAFFTYSLLVEGSEERLMKWTESGGIDTLFYDLIQHYFDPDWNEPLLEAATRMYQKMQLKGRQTFRRGVVKLLESVPQSDYTNRMATRKLYVVLDLAYVSEAGEDPTFCASLFEAIDSLVADHEALEQAFDELDDEDEDLYEATSDLGNNQQEISGGIFLLLQLAARIPAKTLGSYENRIHELYNRIEFNFKEDVVYLLSKITLREDARGELDQLLKKVINTLPSYTKISSVRNLFDQEVTPEDYESFPDVLIELVHKAFLFCRSFGEWQSDDVQLVLDTSRVFSDRFMNPSFFEKDGERALLSMTLLECLADLPDDVNVLDSMHDLFFRAQLAGTDCGVDFQDKLTYWKRLDGLVTALRSNSSLLGSSLLAYLLHFVQPGHLAMARYRSDYREVAERLILDNASRLAAPVGAAIESEVAEVVENLLVAPVFEFDRNISLDLVMSYSDNLGALRLRLMMELLERRSAIYEPRYLGFLREFLVTPGNEIEVAEFLEWDGLYTHTSNIPFLRDAFQYLITGSEVDRTIFDQSSVFLLMGVSRFTMLVSRSEEWRIEDVIEVLQGVLVAPEVVDVLSEDQQLEIMRAEDLIGYPLAFQATGDSQFAVDYDYPHFRTEVPAEATRLLNLLCLYLIPLATAEQLARVKIVSQGMPRGLYDDFEDYAQRFHLQKERFSEEEFERLGQ